MAIDSTQLASFNDVLSALGKSLPGATSANYQAFTDQTNQNMGQFVSQFTNLVGRAPTDSEKNAFLTNFVVPNVQALRTPGSSLNNDIRNQIVQYVSDNGQQAAQDTATQKLQALQGQNNDLANLFRTQGNQAINDTEQSLLDYQSKLIEKIRPSLITSLAAQGLLDTGGLNQAVAGAQADLANSAQPFLAQARLNNENAANQIAFSGAAAPAAYQTAAIQNQLPYLQAQGQNAVSSNYNTFLTNLNFQNQMALQHQAAQDQQGLQPGFGRSFLTSFGSSLGTNLGDNFNGPNWVSALNGGGKTPVPSSLH